MILQLLKCFTVLLPILAVSSCKPSSTLSSSELRDVESDSESWFEFFRPTNLVRLSVEELQRQKLKLKVRIFDFDMADILGTDSNLNMAVRRTNNGWYQRSDSWQLGVSINPGTIITAASGASLPVNIELTSGREIEYIRAFPDYRQSVAALPKTIIDLPLNATKARAMMTGDIASMPVNMGLRLGVGTSTSGGSAATGVFWIGSFRITVFRLDGGFVRVKATSERSRGFYLSAQASAELNLFGYGPFGLIDLDRQVERGLGLDFAKFVRQNVRNGETLAVDYVFNLEHRDGVTAFDALLANTLKIKAAKLAMVASGAKTLEMQSFANLDYAEILSRLDEGQPGERRRVSRVFRGSNAYTGSIQSSHLGTRLLRSQSNKSLTFNTLRQYGDRGSAREHKYFVFNKSRSVKSFVTPIRNQHDVTATAIFAEGQNSADESKFVELAFSLNAVERWLKTVERSDLLGRFAAVLGPFYSYFKPDAVLPSQPMEKFESKLHLAFSHTLINKMLQSAEEDEQLYEKQLWYALWLITPQFAGRIGPRTSGPADDLAGSMRNFFKNSLESIRYTVRTAVTLRFEGIHGQTVNDLVKHSLNLRRNGTSTFCAQLMRLLEKDESAEEIVPAFLLMLAYKYNAPPSIVLDHTWLGQREPSRQEYGENSNAGLEDELARVYSNIHSKGYDR